MWVVLEVLHVGRQKLPVLCSWNAYVPGTVAAYKRTWQPTLARREPRMQSWDELLGAWETSHSESEGFDDLRQVSDDEESQNQDLFEDLHPDEDFFPSANLVLLDSRPSTSASGNDFVLNSN